MSEQKPLIEGSTFPKTALRLVVQIEDTPRNRQILQGGYYTMSEYLVRHGIEGRHNVVKTEQINISEVFFPAKP